MAPFLNNCVVRMQRTLWAHSSNTWAAIGFTQVRTQEDPGHKTAGGYHRRGLRQAPRWEDTVHVDGQVLGACRGQEVGKSLQVPTREVSPPTMALLEAVGPSGG